MGQRRGRRVMWQALEWGSKDLDSVPSSATGCLGGPGQVT